MKRSEVVWYERGTSNQRSRVRFPQREFVIYIKQKTERERERKKDINIERKRE